MDVKPTFPSKQNGMDKESPKSAFAGSTSSTSINRELVKFVLKNFQEHEINLIDLNDFTMPVFSVDLEKKGFPDEAHNFLKQIEEY